MFFEQAREQAARAYERDGTDSAVSTRMHWGRTRYDNPHVCGCVVAFVQMS